MAATAVMEPVETMTNPQVKQALATSTRALQLTVKSVDDRILAGELGVAISQLQREVETFFKPMKDDAFKTHRTICAKEQEVLRPLEQAKKHLSLQIGTFDQEQERLRREEEARLQAEADRLAKEEADRLAQEQAIEDAIQLEAEGDKSGAEAVLNHPAPVAAVSSPVILERAIPKVNGVSGSTNWKFRITNEADIPREYLMVDEKKIGQVVRAMKEKTNIPGVQAYSESGARFKA